MKALPVLPSKATLVRDRIRDLIENGEIAPGARLNVDAIARALGVSKIPVREAISQLEAIGLVVNTPHAGARVAPRSARDLQGIYLVRAALEPLAARLAAASLSDADLAALEHIQREMETAHRAGTLTVLSDANRAFHISIARATGYRPLADMVEETLRRVAPYRSRMVQNASTWDSILAEHAAIVDALKAHDPARAEAMARVHVERRLAGELAEQLPGVE